MPLEIYNVRECSPNKLVDHSYLYGSHKSPMTAFAGAHFLPAIDEVSGERNVRLPAFSTAYAEWKFLVLIQ
jgi:hypothetical protein